MKHRLKIKPEFFEAIRSREKTFEVRKNDRDFKRNDTLILCEYADGEYTGRELERTVSYIYYGKGEYGLLDGYCIMALKMSKPITVLY